MATISKRKNKNGQIRFKAIIRIKGVPTTSKTFSTRLNANKWVQKSLQDIEAGIYFDNLEAKKHTLNELIDKYIIHRQRTKNIDNKRINQLKLIQQHIGHNLLFNVTPSLLSKFKDDLLTGRSNATVNRYLSALSHVFTMAVNEWEWLESNPMKKISKLKEPNGRVRYLSDDERKELLLKCRESNAPDLYAVVVTALFTGMRQGEILNMRWNDINFKNKSITIPNTKNGDIRTVPLVGLAFDVLLKMSKVRSINNDLVFSNKRNETVDIRPAWRLMIKKTSIDNFKFHDLRHTAASYLAMSGASLNEIAAILGHKTLNMVMRYAHLSKEHNLNVAERMAISYC